MSSLFLLLLSLFFYLSPISSISITISNSDRRDIDGTLLDAHDSKFYYHQEDGLFYWFAASYGSCIEPSGNTGCANMTIGACGFRSDHNVTLFVSYNLRDWENRGVVFQAKYQLPADSTFFAPKTVYNKKTNEWVMWMNYLVNNFGNSFYGVAVSKSATGPFKMINNKVNTLRYPDQGDENLFIDDNGDGYLIYTSIPYNHAISVEKLTDNYYETLGANASSGFIGAANCEAPMMFKRHNLYYAVFGTTCCYCESGSPVTAYVASSPMGPYSVAGYFGDLHSQSTDIFVYPDDSGDVQALYVGDHWQSAPDHQKGHDKSVFAPLIFSADGLSVKTNGYQDQFTINVQVKEKYHDIAMQK